MYFSITIEFGLGRRNREKRTITAWSWKRLSDQVKNRDGSVCQYCGAYAPGGGADHVTPLSRGGTDALDNLVWACRECNASKSDKTPEEWDAPGEPAATQTVRVEVKLPDDDKPVTLWANQKTEFIERFARAALNESLTQEGSRLSRRRFNELRDEAIARRLVIWQSPEHHTQGVRATPEGKQAFEKLLAELNDGQGQLL